MNEKKNKLKDTIDKHKFDEKAAKKIDSTANRNIQQIFDKSVSPDDTLATEINTSALKDLPVEPKDQGEIIIDIPDGTNTGLNNEIDELSEDELDDEIEFAESSDNDDDDFLDLSEEDEVEKEDIKYEYNEKSNPESVSLKFGSTEDLIEEDNEDDISEVSEINISENENKDNLIGALKDAQSIENEFASAADDAVDNDDEDEDEGVSLNDIYEHISDDELSPTMVDINRKDLMSELDGEEEDEKIEEKSDIVDLESDIMDHAEPSFSIMPEGADEITKLGKNENDKEVHEKEEEFASEFEDESDDEIKKEFGFEENDSTQIDTLSKLHQVDHQKVEPKLPAMPLNEDDEEDMTRVTNFSPDMIDQLKNEDAYEDNSFKTEENTRIIREEIQKEMKKDNSEKGSPASYSESEMLKHQTTIRILRDDRQSLLDEIEDLKDKNVKLHKENVNMKAELDEIQIELAIIKKRHSEDLSELKYNLNLSEDKKKMIEEKFKKNQSELGAMGERVRVDLEKLRRKEKDLENQLELVQMDTANQVQNRESKILELKRKIDALEFNMENTVLKEQKAREDKKKLEDRLRSIMKTLRGSIRLLEDDLDLDDDILKHMKDM